MSGQPEPRVVNRRKHDFFIVDNPVIDQRIEQVEAKRRADVGWTYTVLCRLASNETGEATLRISYLEKKTGRSKPVLIECLKWLQKLELLAVRKNREGGRQSASTYVLLTVSRVKDDNSEGEVQSKQEQESRVNTDYRSTKTLSTKTSVEANASSEPQSVGLEKYIVDNIYTAMREARLRLPNEHFKYQLGRAKDVLEKDDPTDEEIEALPSAFVDLWTIKGKADVHSALMEYRRQKARPELVNKSVASRAPWEPINPHGKRESTLSKDELARRRAQREETSRLIAAAMEADKGEAR